MRISDMYNYNVCIAAASQIDLITSMIDLVCEHDALSVEDYTQCVSAQALLYEVSKRVASRAETITRED